MMCVLALSMVLTTNADERSLGFRGGTQSLCSGKEQVILKTNHVCEIWEDGILAYRGTWERSGTNVVIMTFDDTTLRAVIVTDNGGTRITKMTFQGDNYYPCSR